MQAADNVKFRGGLANTLLRALVNFLQRKRVPPGALGSRPNAHNLQCATQNIGRINVPMTLKYRDIPVSLLRERDSANHPTASKSGERLKRYAVLKSETLSGEHFVCNGLQPLVGNGQFRHVLYTSRIT